jgi:hypothetical protein
MDKTDWQKLMELEKRLVWVEESLNLLETCLMTYCERLDTIELVLEEIKEIVLGRMLGTTIFE